MGEIAPLKTDRLELGAFASLAFGIVGDAMVHQDRQPTTLPALSSLGGRRACGNGRGARHGNIRGSGYFH